MRRRPPATSLFGQPLDRHGRPSTGRGQQTAAPRVHDDIAAAQGRAGRRVDGRTRLVVIHHTTRLFVPDLDAEEIFLAATFHAASVTTTMNRYCPSPLMVPSPLYRAYGPEITSHSMRCP